MRIYLIGMMGSGKTKLGKKLAKAIAYRFIDVDAFIEEKEKKSIAALFQDIGEEKFRELEHQTIKTLQELDNIVISTGGGLPYYHNNMDLINENGISIYLKAEPALLKSRLINKKETRPLISRIPDDDLQKYLEDLLGKRKAFYEKASIHISAINLNDKALIYELEKKGYAF
ncbi:MAG: shikimate kinase [Bacteroidales bacterium]|nr:shikimate kinase [Bacteroidales bacterium]